MGSLPLAPPGKPTKINYTPVKKKKKKARQGVVRSTGSCDPTGLNQEAGRKMPQGIKISAELH